MISTTPSLSKRWWLPRMRSWNPRYSIRARRSEKRMFASDLPRNDRLQQSPMQSRKHQALALRLQDRISASWLWRGQPMCQRRAPPLRQLGPRPSCPATTEPSSAAPTPSGRPARRPQPCPIPGQSRGSHNGDLLRDGSFTPNLHSGRQGHSGGTRLGMRETRPLVRTSTKLMNVKSVTVLAPP